MLAVTLAPQLSHLEETLEKTFWTLCSLADLGAPWGSPVKELENISV